MLLDTTTFGKIEISEEKIVHFKDGVPGFENLKKFVIIILEQTHPFIWLQSIEEDISFPVMSPFEIDSEYSPNVDDHDLDEIKVQDEKDILVLVICVIPKDITQMTANMAAPIVINIKSGLGKQVLTIDERYKVRQPIYNLISHKMNGG